MANWLNRTTLRYQKSEDPPLVEQHEWIRNPSLPDGCESWEDVVVDGDSVRAPNSDERALQLAVRIASAKTAKIAAIDARTAQIIEDGSVRINGESLSTRLTQQTSLLGIKAAFDAGLPGGSFPKSLSATNGETYVCSGLHDFVRICGMVFAFVDGAKNSGRSLKESVLSATTLDEVSAVSDDRT